MEDTLMTAKTKPERVREEPKEQPLLPEVKPEEWIPVEPIRQPARQPVEVGRREKVLLPLT